MKKRVLSLLLAGMLSIGLTLPAAGAVKTPYADIPDNHWASEAVTDLYQNGIMKGTSETTFSPAGVFTRAMFVTMLGRLEGVDTTLYRGLAFEDVKADSWYAPYVRWASEVGVVKGTSLTTFSPDAPITREQYCTIMNRYIESKGKGLIGEPTAAISDLAKVSNYALTSVKNMVSLGLCNLYGENRMFPQRNMTRVEIAGLFCQFTWWLREKDIPIEIPAYNYGGLYASDYLGMTVKEIKTLCGSDLALDQERWYYGGSLRVLYADGRLPCDLFFQDVPGRSTDDGVIDLVESTNPKCLISPDLRGDETYIQLCALPYEIELYTEETGLNDDFGAIAKAYVKLNDKVTVIYNWYAGENWEADSAGMVAVCPASSSDG